MGQRLLRLAARLFGRRPLHCDPQITLPLSDADRWLTLMHDRIVAVGRVRGLR